MKLKLDSHELQSLTSLLDVTVKKYAIVMTGMEHDNKKAALVPFGKGNSLRISDDEQMETMLFKSIFEEMWVKFQKKSFEYRAKHSIELKPHQAIAFHLEFNGIVDVTSYLGNLTQSICNRIHQEIISIAQKQTAMPVHEKNGGKIA